MGQDKLRNEKGRESVLRTFCRFVIDGQPTDVTGFAMRVAAVTLPDLGTGPDTPIVVSYWFAARGQTVWEGERLVEVLVGPATFDVPAPATGRLTVIRAREDDLVVPGALLGSILVLDEDGDDGSKDGPEPGGSDDLRDARGRTPRPGHPPK
jgi:pyruvate/2-oxoglutarate dehydrogenase complex dihydrolipoamide acyltransferase (E2) component